MYTSIGWIPQSGESFARFGAQGRAGNDTLEIQMWRWMLYATCAIGVAAQAPDAPPDRAVGQRIFDSQCALCHGESGTGGRGPNLHRPKLNKAPDDEALRTVISDGIPPEMPGAWQLHPHEV